MGSVGLTRCRPPGPAGFRNVGLWLPLFPSPASFHTQVKNHLVHHHQSAPARLLKSCHLHYKPNHLQTIQTALPPLATQEGDKTTTYPPYWRSPVSLLHLSPGYFSGESRFRTHSRYN